MRPEPQPWSVAAMTIVRRLPWQQAPCHTGHKSAGPLDYRHGISDRDSLVPRHCRRISGQPDFQLRTSSSASLLPGKADNPVLRISLRWGGTRRASCGTGVGVWLGQFPCCIRQPFSDTGRPSFDRSCLKLARRAAHLKDQLPRRATQLCHGKHLRREMIGTIQPSWGEGDFGYVQMTFVLWNRESRERISFGPK